MVWTKPKLFQFLLVFKKIVVPENSLGQLLSEEFVGKLTNYVKTVVYIGLQDIENTSSLIA